MEFIEIFNILGYIIATVVLFVAIINLASENSKQAIIEVILAIVNFLLSFDFLYSDDILLSTILWCSFLYTSFLLPTKYSKQIRNRYTLYLIGNFVFMKAFVSFLKDIIKSAPALFIIGQNLTTNSSYQLSMLEENLMFSFLVDFGFFFLFLLLRFAMHIFTQKSLKKLLEPIPKSEQTNILDKYSSILSYNLIISLSGPIVENSLLSMLFLFRFIQRGQERKNKGKIEEAGEDKFFKNIANIEDYPIGNYFFKSGILIIEIYIYLSLFSSMFLEEFNFNPIFTLFYFLGLASTLIIWTYAYFGKNTIFVPLLVCGINLAVLFILLIDISLIPVTIPMKYYITSFYGDLASNLVQIILYIFIVVSIYALFEQMIKMVKIYRKAKLVLQPQKSIEQPIISPIITKRKGIQLISSDNTKSIPKDPIKKYSKENSFSILEKQKISETLILLGQMFYIQIFLLVFGYLVVWFSSFMFASLYQFLDYSFLLILFGFSIITGYIFLKSLTLLKSDYDLKKNFTIITLLGLLCLEGAAIGFSFLDASNIFELSELRIHYFKLGTIIIVFMMGSMFMRIRWKILRNFFEKSQNFSTLYPEVDPSNGLGLISLGYLMLCFSILIIPAFIGIFLILFGLYKSSKELKKIKITKNILAKDIPFSLN